ncbi:hypothetical protein EJB05_18504 [Eragrostis curvula]|uniref:Uncharacterized protein n=1 Tax=Eragrostis curvula TaxID=38414 RepID=A0A5J9VM74_9POAL|nr:hypothetical protein EJB05_18504 [Eragrostis curvula]
MDQVPEECYITSINELDGERTKNKQNRDLQVWIGQLIRTCWSSCDVGHRQWNEDDDNLVASDDEHGDAVWNLHRVDVWF